MDRLPAPTTEVKIELNQDETRAIVQFSDRCITERRKIDPDPTDNFIWIEVRYDDIPNMTPNVVKQAKNKLESMGWIIRLHERKMCYTTGFGRDETGHCHLEKYFELFSTMKVRTSHS
jgi:hypothetical protein